MIDSTILAVLVALAAALFVAVLIGYIRPKPDLPADAPATASSGFIANLDQDLAEAGIDMTPTRFMAYSLLLGVSIGLTIQVVFHVTLLALVAGILLTVYGLRNFYVGRIATKRRRTQMVHIIAASREIAALIDAGNDPDAALSQYASQASSKGVEALTREKNQIAEAIAEALRMRVRQGFDLSEALRESAERLGNRYYRAMCEVYIRNERSNKNQVARGLMFFAEDVNHILVLRRSLANAMGLPLASYKGMGILAPAMGLYMCLNLESAAEFWTSWLGQIAIIIMSVYWYIGYWLQRRALDERD